MITRENFPEYRSSHILTVCMKNIDLYHYVTIIVDFSFLLQNLHFSRVFPTNEWPRACSRAVNGEDLTCLTIIRIRNRYRQRGQKRESQWLVCAISALAHRWWKTGVKMERTSRGFSPRIYIRIVEQQRFRQFSCAFTWMQSRIRARSTQPMVGKSAGKTLMDLFLRIRSRVADLSRDKNPLESMLR